MRRTATSAVLAFMLIGCGHPAEPDHQAEWRSVLEKKSAASVEASPERKQVYADTLAAFVRRHPNHIRGREVYQRIQLEFARELGALGRYQDAIRFYRAVLAHDPRNAEARAGLTDAYSRLAVSREKLLTVERGMSHRDVAGVLGKPVPGWTAKNARRGSTVEAWYYRTTTGGLAGVYFRDGRVFAAEENSQAKVGL